MATVAGEGRHQTAWGLAEKREMLCFHCCFGSGVKGTLSLYLLVFPQRFVVVFEAKLLRSLTFSLSDVWAFLPGICFLPTRAIISSDVLYFSPQQPVPGCLALLNSLSLSLSDATLSLFLTDTHTHTQAQFLLSLRRRIAFSPPPPLPLYHKMPLCFFTSTFWSFLNLQSRRKILAIKMQNMKSGF